MPSNSPLGALIYPADADPLANVYDYFRQLVDKLDVKKLVKPADESVPNSAVLQNDDHLLFAVAANKTYVFEMVLFVTNTGTQTADLKIALTFPAGAMAFGAHGLDPAGTTSPLGSAQTLAFPAAASGVSTIPLGAGSDSLVIVKGSFATTAAGTVRLQWAQNTAVAAATTIKKGSYLKAEIVG